MNSLTLKENGFANFIPLKELQFVSLPLDKASVLVLVDSSLSGTQDSDILYIGKSKKPAKRVFGGYIGGYGGKTTQKINSKLLNDGYIEKVAISWMQDNNPKAKQQELLVSFKKEHRVFPIWNGNKKASTASKAAPIKASMTRSRRKQPTKTAT